jgi:molybdate transport system permease protein
MNQSIVSIAAFTVATAAVAMLIALPLALAVAWLLARLSFRGKAVIETVVMLPLVLPPVAIGLLLLQTLGRARPLGRLLDGLGVDVVFTWKAVVIAMVVMGLPLLVRSARAGFEQVDRRYEAVAATLGARPLRVFFTISLPLALPGVLAGSVLGFARAIGEFGATIMVAGSIPGETRTLAVAIYSFTETGRDEEAMVLIGLSLAIAFVALWASNRLSRRM